MCIYCLFNDADSMGCGGGGGGGGGGASQVSVPSPPGFLEEYKNWT
jgi:hypothetical protein